MPVIIRLTTVGGAKPIKNAAKTISNLEKNISSNVRQKLTQPRAGQKKANVSSLYTTLGNTLSGAMATPDVNPVVVERRGKQIGTVKGIGKPKEIVQSFLTGKDSNIVLQFPSISKTHGIIIRPKSGELAAKRDRRTAGAYNIHLTDKAITKYRKQLETTIHTALKQEVKKTLTKKQASGVHLQIAAQLGVAADRIIIAQQDLIGRDISKLVRAEMKKRMGKGKSEQRLNYRTGEFVRGVTDVKIVTNELINYTFDKYKYGVHEEAKGSPKGKNYTRIHALTPKGLSFFNKKRGEAVGGVRFVDIPSRPIIQQSIRSVALKLFDRKFRMEAR